MISPDFHRIAILTLLAILICTAGPIIAHFIAKTHRQSWLLMMAVICISVSITAFFALSFLVAWFDLSHQHPPLQFPILIRLIVTYASVFAAITGLLLLMKHERFLK